MLPTLGRRISWDLSGLPGLYPQTTSLQYRKWKMFHRKTGPAKTFGLKFNLKCRIVLWMKLKSCLILHECLICSKIKFSSSKCETQLQRTWEILIYFFFYISDFIFKCNFTNRQTIKIKVLIFFFYQPDTLRRARNSQKKYL